MTAKEREPRCRFCGAASLATWSSPTGAGWCSQDHRTTGRRIYRYRAVLRSKRAWDEFNAQAAKAHSDQPS